MRLHLMLLTTMLLCVSMSFAQTLKGRSLKVGEDITAIKYLPNGSQIVTSTFHGKVTLWETTGKKIWEINLEVGSTGLNESVVNTYAMDVAGDGNEIAIAINKGFVRNGVLQKNNEYSIVIIDAATGRLIRTLSNGLKPLVYSPSGKLASQMKGGGFAIWNTRSGDSIKLMQDIGRKIHPEDFSADGRMLALSLGEQPATYTGDDYSNLLVWDTLNNTKITSLNVKSRFVDSARFSPDRSRLVLLCEGPTQMAIFDTHAWTLLYRSSESGHESLVFSADGKYSASYRFLGDYGRVYLFDNARLKMKKILDIKPEPKSIAFSPNGKELAVGRRDGNVVFYGL